MSVPDPIKDAFQRAKQDILSLKQQMSSIAEDITLIKITLEGLKSQQKDRQTNQQTDKTNYLAENKAIPAHNSADNLDLPLIIDESQAFQQKEPTDKLNELYKLSQYSLKTPNNEFSTGNGGVPTDRQTNQQTDRHIFSLNKSVSNSVQTSINQSNVRLIEVSRALENLDSLKQNLKSQFKRLTKQELIFFSTVYQLENEGFVVDYPLIASKLALSESSVRDYSLKIIRKGLPLIKTKENNKKILLSISPELKKIASLQAILSLRKL